MTDATSNVDVILTSYYRGVELGYIPIGGKIYTGRESVRTYIAKDLSLTEGKVRWALRSLVLRGELSPRMEANYAWTIPRSQPTHIYNGCLLVGGDLHAWPGTTHPIWWAFCRLAHQLQPLGVVLNGDIIDGAAISRHPRMRPDLPTLADELDCVNELLSYLPENGRKFWNIGNHDLRFANYLANQAPELMGCTASLQERFPDWQFAYSTVVNDDVEIRHRFRSGAHAGYNNASLAGRTMVTSHTHQLADRSVITRNGRLFGVEIGQLSDPDGPQFEYGEGTPSRHWPGFVVLTFREGELQPPEKCEWHNGQAVFRGQPVDKPRVRVAAGSGPA